jgi:ubiquinone/menaquinone biosynthesis C-methylase UbiE
MRQFMRFFFYLLYHPFAFAYDFVATFVSFGQWKNWGQSILPFISGTHILELGHGPGHLQRFLSSRQLILFGLDESMPMIRLAKKRIGTNHKLTRGIAQTLPYKSESFDCVISTFPTEYIFHHHTLSEIKRCLRTSGRLIVIPAAFPKSGFLQWLYKVTGENQDALNENIKTRMATHFINAGFQTEIKIIDVKSSQLLIVIAKK